MGVGSVVNYIQVFSNSLFLFCMFLSYVYLLQVTNLIIFQKMIYVIYLSHFCHIVFMSCLPIFSLFLFLFPLFYWIDKIPCFFFFLTASCCPQLLIHVECFSIGKLLSISQLQLFWRMAAYIFMVPPGIP